MKVAFISRSTLHTNPGGDTIQILQTAKQLQQLGLSVDVCLSNETIAYDKYDLLHFFNIIRPGDMLRHIKLSGKPYVVSTIFVDYYEYEQKSFRGFRKMIARIFSPDAIEYLKVLARVVVNGEKLASPSYFFYGQRRSVKKVIAGASMLLPNSENEYKRLVTRYQCHQKYAVVYNGIDAGLFSYNNDRREDDLVICVARIEPLKNQLLLIQALNNSPYRLLIIGKPSANQMSYYEECKRQAGANVQFIDYLPQQELAAYYAQAKVHVLPSWFETTGLSSLEAGAMGCNIVITGKGDTAEYFGKHAYYCEPDSAASILQAVKQAAAAPIKNELSALITSKYTWQQAARQTATAYGTISLKT